MVERWIRAVHYARAQLGAVGGFIRRFFVLFGVGLLLLLLGLLLFSPIFAVRQISVVRTDPRIDVDRVQQALVTMFHRHLFFLSSQDIDAPLKAAMPDLTSVAVQKRYPSTLVVRITLDPIINRLAIEHPEANTPPGQQAGSGALARLPGAEDFLTAQGLYVQYRASQVSPLLPLIRIVDWGARPTPWKELLSADFLLLMRQTEQALHEQFGQDVLERIVYLRGQEFHMRMKAVTLWFDRRSPLDEQMQRYRIFLRTVGLDKAKEYIDLRLADRVVYK